MQLVQRLLPALAAVAFSASSLAGTTVYTSSATFLAQVASGAYTETFTGLSSPAGTSMSFSGSGFSYTASSPGSLYLEDNTLSANQVDMTLTLTFGAGVYAVGANFFAVNINPDFQVATMTVGLSDGTTASFTPTSLGDSYRGFVSDVAITSLTFSASPTNQGLYATLDNLTVGAAVPVPEPASLVLVSLGLVGLLAATRRRSA